MNQIEHSQLYSTKKHNPRTYGNKFFIDYYQNVESRAYNAYKTIAEIVQADFATRGVNISEKREPDEPYRFNTDYGELVYLPERRTAISPLKPKGAVVTLSPTQGRMLSALMENPTKVTDLKEVLPDWDKVEADVIRLYVSRLRSKLGDTNPIKSPKKNFRLIHTVIGLGYSLTNTTESLNPQ